MQGKRATGGTSSSRPRPPPDNELVIGLVGAAGVDLASVASQLRAELADFRYSAPDLHLTDAFDALPWPEPLVQEPFDERMWSYMDAGNLLRERWGRNAMALLGINRIALARDALTDSKEIPADRVAYVLRSMKRPEEVRLLREVYGGRFLLIGAAASEVERTEYLKSRIRETRVPPHNRDPVYSPQALIERDEREDHVPHGQLVGDTFHRADCFVHVGPNLANDLKRVLDIWFRDPERSPSREEFGMFQAVAAARRSADLGRQVGAAICTADGDVVAVGTNEVPKPGGGLYWEGDAGDDREVRRGEDTNRKLRQVVAKDIANRLGDLPGADAPPADDLLDILEASAFGDILEFVRAVHAEMAALMYASRRGVAVAGCTLYTTTFPCHHCARHIVAAGIRQVIYVAPYPKSRAQELHGDAISLGPSVSGRIPFEAFVGVGPRRYLDWFEYSTRKGTDGKLLSYDRGTAEPEIADRDAPELRSDRLPYIDREHRAAVLLSEQEAASDFSMTRES
jgi:deoxycytidylate deaminase